MFPEIEKKSLTEITKFQEELMHDQIRYNVKYSPFYKKLFEKNGIDIDKIRKIADLRAIPFTTKDDLQKYNKSFFAVPLKKIVDYVTTSGTLGEPVIFGLTEKDLDRLAYNEYISFLCSDAEEDDIFQITTTLDRRFMAGIAYFLGIRKLGAGLIRVGSGIPELQWDTINRIKPTALVAVPSFILKLISYAEKHGIDYRSSSIKKAICIGEPLRNNDFSLNTLSRRIKEKWDIALYSTYASTEMGAAFAECRYGIGGHHHPELLIIEFIDELGKPVPPAAPGELVITTLGVEGMPLLRFRTGDICYHYSEPCKCGRNTIRLGPIIGRRKQMIKYKGTTLYPAALFDILDGISGVYNYVVEVYRNNLNTDEILIHVGTSIDTTLAFEKELKDHFRAKLRAAPSLKFHSPDEIMKMQFPAMSRKPVKFIDKR